MILLRLFTKFWSSGFQNSAECRNTWAAAESLERPDTGILHRSTSVQYWSSIVSLFSQWWDRPAFVRRRSFNCDTVFNSTRPCRMGGRITTYSTSDHSQVTPIPRRRCLQLGWDHGKYWNSLHYLRVTCIWGICGHRLPWRRPTNASACAATSWDYTTLCHHQRFDIRRRWREVSSTIRTWKITKDESFFLVSISAVGGNTSWGRIFCIV